jgi:hypothetical protein
MAREMLQKRYRYGLSDAVESGCHASLPFHAFFPGLSRRLRYDLWLALPRWWWPWHPIIGPKAKGMAIVQVLTVSSRCVMTGCVFSCFIEFRGSLPLTRADGNE